MPSIMTNPIIEERFIFVKKVFLTPTTSEKWEAAEEDEGKVKEERERDFNFHQEIT